MFRFKRYAVELGGGFAIYITLLIGAAAVERVLQPAGALRLAINLLPVIGLLAVAWAVMRGLWRMDELQRRIQFDAIAIAFLGTAIVIGAWAFAEGAGVPRMPTFAVFPIMASLWCAGLVAATLRYR